MSFVLTGIFGLMLLTALVWLAVFLRVKKRADAERAQIARDAETDRLLRTPGEKLRCIACNTDFEGPLPEEGCPHCHTTAFVVPARLRPQAGGGAGDDGLRIRQRAGE